MTWEIRQESADDHRQVEELTREAFWNLYVPGCDEHCLVHEMRSHPDFIPELAFVALDGDRIVGNIMYARSHLINETGERLDALTFGPLSVLPGEQGKGVGSALIRHSVRQAAASGERVIVIEGHPRHYCKHGFRGSKSLGVSDAEGRFPYSLLVLELEPGCLAPHAWRFVPSDVYELDDQECQAFDRTFPSRRKEWQPSQEEFRLACEAFILE